MAVEQFAYVQNISPPESKHCVFRLGRSSKRLDNILSNIMVLYENNFIVHR